MQPRTRRALARGSLGLVLALLASTTMAILWLQRSILFPGTHLRGARDAGEGVAGLERLWLSTDEGRVEGWLLPGDGVSAAHPGPAVVYAHGNGELIDDWPDALAPYRRLGVSVLLPEYRGYGRSAGHPSEAAIRADLARFYDLLAARPEVDRTRIVFHGRSLGGGAVCALAAERGAPAALILQSTFTSVTDIARSFLVPAFLVRDPFDSRAVVARLHVPTLVVHGRRDRVVPFAHARELVRASPSARLVAYDADHNDCPPDPAPYWREITALLREARVIAPGG